MTVDGLPFSVPRYLHLDLGKLTQCSVACFRYIPMRCESRQEAGNIMMVPVISVACMQFKMKILFLCPCMQMCSLRLQFADLFHNLPLAHKITVNQTGAFYFSQACSEDVFNFFQKQTNDSIIESSYRSVSELMDVFCMAGVH